ncbi:hypothetical protein B0H17DRAFT_1147109 [Mycena rosella]|uniref:Uncharacterized protein n=1 Tax=Mycena rosella TaxID=1033263 RepID=A0AAD7G068_MYCRO|nr:hypothetical protein B0H17DRAFT_1147109 [Mycena rosella]
MNKHITFRQRIFSSGKYNSTKEKDSNNGYIHDCDSPLTTEEMTALKKIPSRPGFDRALVVGSKEADTIATQFCSEDLHPQFRAGSGDSSAAEDSDSIASASDGSDDEESFPVTAKDIDFELDTPIRLPPHPNQDAVCPESDAIVLGKDLTVSQALAHAAHHIVTERVLSEFMAKDEAELDAIDKELDANPETSVSGRMRTAPLLNPAPPTPAAILSTSVAVIARQLGSTREKTRTPEINAEYLGGKFSLNHAAQQLKEGLQSEGLRRDTTFQKARYRRWILSGPAVEWTERCRLDVALSNLHVPKLRSRGVDAITPIRLGMARCRIGTSLNLFRHIVPVHRGVSALAFFNHAPISELVYPLTCGSLSTQPNAMFSIPGGDSGHECWDALSSSAAVYRILDLPADNSTDDSEEEDDYDEPISGSSSKKRRPKPPRGTSKCGTPIPLIGRQTCESFPLPPPLIVPSSSSFKHQASCCTNSGSLILRLQLLPVSYTTCKHKLQAVVLISGALIASTPSLKPHACTSSAEATSLMITDSMAADLVIIGKQSTMTWGRRLWGCSAEGRGRGGGHEQWTVWIIDINYT